LQRAANTLGILGIQPGKKHSTNTSTPEVLRYQQLVYLDDVATKFVAPEKYQD
jgi:hypothetical protein